MSIPVDRLQCNKLEINDNGALKIMVDKFSKTSPIILGDEIKTNEKLTLNVKLTEIEEVKNIIDSFIFMLEDSRIDRDIRLQHLESCRGLKGYYVGIDK